MRLDPLVFLLDKNLKLNKKFYFISGNESTLIQKIKRRIVEGYKKKENLFVQNIDTIDEYRGGDGLFEDKKIYYVKNVNRFDEKFFKKTLGTADIFIFAQENSQKIKKIKNLFVKNQDSVLMDCYELDRSSKIKILNDFLKFTTKVVPKELYWLLVEKLDNRYAFFESALSNVLELNQKDINIINIKKLLTIDDSNKERIFFSLLKKNKEIIEIYREKVLTNSDVNELYYYFKFFSQLIIDCGNENEYDRKIPIYLFKEKSFLIDVYRKFNLRKKKLLIKLLSSTETALRSESNLSLAYGLRFVLNVKKITIS